jgi:hypothetical protein
MTRKEDHNMTRLVSPQATPQDIENRLAQKADFIKNATEVWGDVLSPEAINAAWEEMAAHIRQHTPPTVFHVMKDFCDRLGSRR